MLHLPLLLSPSSLRALLLFVLRTDYAKSHWSSKKQPLWRLSSTINGEAEKGGHSLTSGPCRMPETAMLNYGVHFCRLIQTGGALSLLHAADSRAWNYPVIDPMRWIQWDSMLAKMQVIRIRPFWFGCSTFVVSKNKSGAYLLRASISYRVVLCRITTKQESELTLAGLIMLRVS